MRLQVKGKNVEITPSFRQYAETKLAKLDKQLAELTQVELELSEEKNPSIPANHVAEATIFAKGSTLRAREAAPDDPHVDRPARRQPRAAGQALPREAHRRADGGVRRTTASRASSAACSRLRAVRAARPRGARSAVSATTPAPARPVGRSRGIHGVSHASRASGTPWSRVEAPGLEGDRAQFVALAARAARGRGGPGRARAARRAVERELARALPRRGGPARARALGGRRERDRGRRAARDRRRGDRARSSTAATACSSSTASARSARSPRSSGPSTSSARAGSTATSGRSRSTRSDGPRVSAPGRARPPRADRAAGRAVPCGDARDRRASRSSSASARAGA